MIIKLRPSRNRKFRKANRRKVYQKQQEHGLLIPERSNGVQSYVSVVVDKEVRNELEIWEDPGPPELIRTI